MEKPLAVTNVLHYPRLDTVMLVENFAWMHSREFKKRALWESLPKKMMYQTFCVIFDYLESSGKIAVNSGGFVVWAWNPKLLKKIALK